MQYLPLKIIAKYCDVRLLVQVSIKENAIKLE